MNDDTHDDSWITSTPGILVILAACVVLPTIIVGSFGTAAFLAVFWAIIAVAAFIHR